MITTAIDTTDVIPLLKALGKVDRELRQNANRRLRDAAAECARGLIPRLHAAASSSQTPQAVLVAQTAKVASDRVPALRIGGSRRVGHRKTPAGRLLWGSEHGGRNFLAERGGAYWITPTVSEYARSSAPRTYQAACVAILSDAGVL
jgi:hypothetical protein